MTQTAGNIVHWGREILSKIIYVLKCKNSTSELECCRLQIQNLACKEAIIIWKSRKNKVK